MGGGEEASRLLHLSFPKCLPKGRTFAGSSPRKHTSLMQEKTGPCLGHGVCTGDMKTSTAGGRGGWQLQREQELR